MKRNRMALFLLPMFVMAASTAWASGFRLPEAGAKAMGMGFAFTAQADDPSAIYFTPAGLTQLEGRNVMAGFSYVQLYGSKFEGVTPLTGGASEYERQRTLQFVFPNAYFTSMHKDSGIAWGIGVFTPFGLSQKYHSRQTSIFRNQVTNIELRTIVVNPTIAYKFNDYLSVGVGVDFMYGTAKLGQTAVVNIPGGHMNVFELDMDGDGTAWGYNAGILLKPTSNLRIGASYRSPFDLKIKKGNASIRNPAGTASADGNAEVSIPATFAVGVAYTINRLTLEVDADWTLWSRYKSLPIYVNYPGIGKVAPEKNWKNSCALRFGAQYQVIDPLAIRLGVVYDPTPVPSETMGPELPDSSRMNYMVGLGYKVGPVTFDWAFMYISRRDRSVNNLEVSTALMTPPGSGFDGRWYGDAWLTGMNLTYNF